MIIYFFYLLHQLSHLFFIDPPFPILAPHFASYTPIVSYFLQSHEEALFLGD